MSENNKKPVSRPIPPKSVPTKPATIGWIGDNNIRKAMPRNTPVNVQPKPPKKSK